MKIIYFLIAFLTQSAFAHIPEGVSVWENRLRCNKSCILKGDRASDAYTVLVIVRNNTLICGAIEADYGLKYGNRSPNGLLVGTIVQQHGGFEYSDSFAQTEDDRGSANFTIKENSIIIRTQKSPSEGYLSLSGHFLRITSQPSKLTDYALNVCKKYNGDAEDFFKRNW